MSVIIRESDGGTKRKVIEKTKEIPKNISEDLEKALDEIWDKIFQQAIMDCPFDTGALMSSIQITKGSTSGLAGGAIKEVTVFDSTISAGDPAIINPKSGMPTSEYARFVHDGHFSQAGHWVPEQPFLENAVAMYEQELNDAIERVMKAMQEKFGSD